MNSTLEKDVDMSRHRFLSSQIFLIGISWLQKMHPIYSQAYAPILCVTSAYFLGMASLTRSV